jgi:hypothetical protein
MLATIRFSLLSSCLLSRNFEIKIYKTIILPVILYDCETGPKRDEVMGEWGEMHNGELHSLYSSRDIIRQIKSRRMRWAGYVARMGEGRNVYRVLLGKPEVKDHLEDQGVDWRMGSKWTLGRLVEAGGSGVDSPGSG